MPALTDREQRLRVLVIAPYYNRTATGESWSTYHWTRGICENCDATVLTTHLAEWDPKESPLETDRLINWTDPKPPKKLQRLSWELKPGYILFYRRARKWIKDALARGETFDLVHQINPLALRYPCPAAGLGLKTIMGPLAGSVETPEGFAKEGTDKQWFRKLRHLDRFRIRRDPLLRRSYTEAAAILGVAPYVQDLLKDLEIQRFEQMSETGVEEISGQGRFYETHPRELRLLFVGRIIRTKGVLDGIRALSLLPEDIPARLDILGAGDLEATCQAEIERLGLQDRVTMHGRISRDEVDGWYERSHVFLFPSFREPSGNVVMEALGHGLPVITCNNGGPGYVVDETCGAKVEPRNPEQLSQDLADAIVRLANDPAGLAKRSAGAIERIREIALWERKIARLMELYDELVPQPVELV